MSQINKENCIKFLISGTELDTKQNRKALSNAWDLGVKAFKKLKRCTRCSKQYIGKHTCEVKETEQERVKREGRY